MGHHENTAFRFEVLTEVNINQSVFTGSVCTTQKMSSKHTARQNFLPVTAQAVTYFMHTDFVPSTLCINCLKL